MRQRLNRLAARCRLDLSALFLFVCVVLATPNSVAASSVPARITIGPAARAGASTSYQLHVEAPGAPILALLPEEVKVAELVVNGHVVRRAGRDVDLGIPPFGHAATVFRLADLTSNDRVEIRENGVAGAPTLLGDPDHLGMVFDSALWTGIGYGILVTLVIFQLMTVFASGEQTLLWYIVWLGAFIGILLVRDGLLPLPAGAAQVVLPLVNLIALAGYVGFAAAYLELRREAPRTFWVFVAANVALAAVPGVASTITHEPPTIDVVFLANVGSMGLGTIIAVLRRRAGFEPASFLALGLVGTLAFFIGKPLRDFTGMESPFLDRWALEIFSVFDFLVFSLGIACRFRFTRREHEHMKDQLRATNLAAGRDPLTGLLNRRGLDEWMNDLAGLSATILFVDIDGFKAVNDEGGHAAGDRALAAVARILSHCVRAQDAVARFGGDEFVVVLANCEDAGGSARDVVARISAAVNGLLPLGTTSDIRIGVSIGTALLAKDIPFSEALERADAEAYRIKENHHAQQRDALRCMPVPLQGS